MQHKGGPRLLITDRQGAFYLERARIHVDAGRIIYHVTDDELGREYAIPHVNLAVLFLGQGTSITQDAARLLGEEGVHLAFTGTGGTPLHMGSLTTYRATEHFRRLLPIYLDERKSLAAAKAIMISRIDSMRTIGQTSIRVQMKARRAPQIETACKRFGTDLGSATTSQELLGFEGQFTKSCYAGFAGLSAMDGDNGFRRRQGARENDPADRIATVNRLIDHGNYLCYGMAGAALWALGIPPHMAVFHGKTRAGGLVFDLADAFKDAIVLPAAFSVGGKARESDPEKVFRARLIDAFDNQRILVRAIATVERMLTAAEQ